MAPLPCGCRPLLWALYGVWREADRHEATLILRADGEDAGPDASTKDDPYLTEELIFASIIGTAWDDLAKEAKAQVLAALGKLDPDTIGITEVRLAINAVDRTMAKIADDDDDTAAEAGKTLNRAITNGANDAATNAEPEDRIDARPEPEEEPEALEPMHVAAGTDLEGTGIGSVWSALLSLTIAYMNTAYSRVAVPAMLAQATTLISDAKDAAESAPMVGGEIDISGIGGQAENIIEKLQEIVGKGFDLSGYWRVVANAMVSRAYHYAYLKAGALSGQDFYRLVAVLDNRTSAVCVALNGMTFSVPAALAIIEPAMDSEDMDAMKLAMPWPKNAAAVTDKTADELAAMGCVAPPFHGNCRTTIRFFSR